MSLNIDIKADIKDVTRMLSDVAKRKAPIAAAKALTFTAERAQAEVKKEMGEVFDNPTRYTLNSTRKTSATVARLMAKVYLKDINSLGEHYLEAQIEGGRRSAKGFEKRLRGVFVIGRMAKVNTHGNLPPSVYSKILADIGFMNMVSGDASNTKTKKRGGKKAITYFMRRSAKTGRRIIYQRTGRDVVPVLVEVNAASYKARLPFYGIVNDVAAKQFKPLFIKQLTRELAKG